jgi:hypothetical protein
MKITDSFQTISFFTAIICVSSSPIFNSLRCPTAESISPCECHLIEANAPYLICGGPEISQETINNLFTTLRLNSTPGSWLDLSAVIITNTQMASLDLASLSRTRICVLDINTNPNLAKITGPPLPLFLSTIQVETISF